MAYKTKYEHYKEYKIILTQIDRDWSEDAWQYKIGGTKIIDECEGYDNAIMYAKKEIDKI
jgi:hypothetical protein